MGKPQVPTALERASKRINAPAGDPQTIKSRILDKLRAVNRLIDRPVYLLNHILRFVTLQACFHTPCFKLGERGERGRITLVLQQRPHLHPAHHARWNGETLAFFAFTKLRMIY